MDRTAGLFSTEEESEATSKTEARQCLTAEAGVAASAAQRWKSPASFPSSAVQLGSLCSEDTLHWFAVLSHSQLSGHPKLGMAFAKGLNRVDNTGG
jgi:hypothetical protein